ncbi:MAG: BRCT domain-containing protein, partial [Phycisphaerales bacterium]
LFKAIHCEKGQTLFRRLQDAGVLLESTKSQNIDPEFDGKTFVITGTFEHWERKKLTDELEKRGAKVSGSVSKNTS